MKAAMSAPPIRVSPRLAASVAALFAAALSGGCSFFAQSQPAPCPAISPLPNAGQLTRFDGRGQDATNLLVHAEVNEATATCELRGSSTVRVSLTVTGGVTRGPIAPANETAATYFVAVMDGERVLQQLDYQMPAQFPPNSDRLPYKSDYIDVSVPVSPGKPSTAYHIFVGFRLTPEELAYNRSHGVR